MKEPRPDLCAQILAFCATSLSGACFWRRPAVRGGVFWLSARGADGALRA